jgi:thiamine-monophosphate kinase
VVGGDVVSAEQLVISVTALGDLRGPGPGRPGGALPGDVVAVCGRLGWAAAGSRCSAVGSARPVSVVAAHRTPEPPYAAGPQAAEAGATAMIDVSDGLLADLDHIAEASNVAIDVQAELIEVPSGWSTWPPRSAPTPGTGCSPEARTTRWPRRSRTRAGCRTAGPRSARSPGGGR